MSSKIRPSALIKMYLILNIVIRRKIYTQSERIYVACDLKASWTTV